MADEKTVSLFGRASRGLWRVFVGIAGVGVTAAGAAMLVLPGPGVLVILLGLAILSTEFRWARHLLNRAATWARAGGHRLRTIRKRHEKATEENG